MIDRRSLFSRTNFIFSASLLLISVFTACGLGGDYGIDIYFVPEHQFLEIEENYQALNHGFFWAYWTPAGGIRHANILISSTLQQRHRNHFIREELTQSLGLMNDSPRYPDSIFYGGPGTSDEFLPIDRHIITMLYQPDIKISLSPAQVRNILSPTYSDDEIDYFIEVALNTEFGSNESAVRKWSGNVPIRIHGDPTDADIGELDRIIEELNQLTEGIDLYVETIE